MGPIRPATFVSTTIYCRAIASPLDIVPRPRHETSDGRPPKPTWRGHIVARAYEARSDEGRSPGVRRSPRFGGCRDSRPQRLAFLRTQACRWRLPDTRA